MGRIAWKHNGKDILPTEQPNYQIENNRLLIANPNKYSRGYYQCLVGNSEGSLKLTIMKKILSVGSVQVKQLIVVQVKFLVAELTIYCFLHVFSIKKNQPGAPVF